MIRNWTIKGSKCYYITTGVIWILKAHSYSHVFWQFIHTKCERKFYEKLQEQSKRNEPVEITWPHCVCFSCFLSFIDSLLNKTTYFLFSAFLAFLLFLFRGPQTTTRPPYLWKEHKDRGASWVKTWSVGPATKLKIG